MHALFQYEGRQQKVASPACAFVHLQSRTPCSSCSDELADFMGALLADGEPTIAASSSIGGAQPAPDLPQPHPGPSAQAARAPPRAQALKPSLVAGLMSHLLAARASCAPASDMATAAAALAGSHPAQVPLPLLGVATPTLRGVLQRLTASMQAAQGVATPSGSALESVGHQQGGDGCDNGNQVRRCRG
jgi:hypothetical protein